MEEGPRLIKSPKYEDIESLIESAGDSLKTFRYFNSRPVRVIDRHIVTLVYKEEVTVGYGHLEEEGGDVWLGICVSEKMRGKGLGGRIMRDLLTHARDSRISLIRLTVDYDNHGAISLYEKMGFEKSKQVGSTLHMFLKLA